MWHANFEDYPLRLPKTQVGRVLWECISVSQRSSIEGMKNDSEVTIPFACQKPKMRKSSEIAVVCGQQSRKAQDN